MRKAPLFPLIVAFTALFLSSCLPRPAAQPTLDSGVLAVAGFAHPSQEWEFLSSSRPVQPLDLPPDLLAELDEMFLGLFKDEPGRILLGPDATRQCQEVALFRTRAEGGGVSGLCYWLEVGRCVPADYLLVPQILDWKEREGTEWGVNEPAMVVFELTLLDIGNQKISRRYRFEESQRSLSEDLLQARKFIRRGGKWLSARELLQDGLRQGLREMGLREMGL